ncbi:MAG: AI-2E family transporter [Candidatus Baltobacteraceae bacterium]|jgi:predicted PurR-regulated permease PerM
MQAALTSARFRRLVLLWVGAVAFGVALLWFASRIPRTLSVFVIAAFIAFGVAPLVAKLERRMPRAAAIAIVYASLLAIVVVLSVLVVPATLGQLQIIGISAPSYIQTAQNWLDQLETALRGHFGKNYLPAGYLDLKDLVAAKLSLGFNLMLASLPDILIGTVTSAIIGLSAIVLSGFFLMRGSSVADSLYSLLPGSRQATARALGAEIAHVFGSYVSGQLALCAITGALIFSFTAFAGFKYALLLGIVSGIAYAVPFAGMIAAHLIGLLLAAPQGLQTVLWVEAIIFAVARVSDNLLVPKIMSESVGVSPIVVMFAVFAGGELFGLPGLLLGIPAAALAKVAWRFLRTNSTERKLLEASVVEPSPGPSGPPEFGGIATSTRAR